MKVVVLGAGVVGATTAYWLARDGHDVTVIDRGDSPGLETSFANGGQVSASHAVPWASPDTPGKILKWIGRGDAPLLFHFRLDSAMWKWCFRFLRECTAERARINIERTLRIADYSRRSLTEFRAESGIEYAAQTGGILHFFHDARALEAASANADVLRDFGLDITTETAEDVVAREPALTSQRDRLAGGLFSPNDESGDAYVFTTEMTRMAEALGAQFQMQTTVTGLESVGSTVSAALTDKGRVEADRFVVSLGAYSPFVLNTLGIRLPIYPAKGYSVTLPVEHPDRAPTVSLTDEEKKLVFSRLGDTLRIAGTAELAGYDTSLTPKRTRAILDRTLELFPGLADRKSVV